MERMTREECILFLLEKPRPAVAAVVRADGRPHPTPVWIDMDGDQIIFTTWHESIKGKAFRRDPQVSLCVDDDQPPFSYVTLDGTVTISEDPAELKHWAGRLAGRYMGEDKTEAYGERNGVPGELLVRVTIRNIMGHKDMAD